MSSDEAAYEAARRAEEAARGAEASREVDLPAFPWQPPRPTARLELQEFTKPQYQTFGTIADTIAGAARMAGFGDAMYYSVPGGFAILVRPEAIDANLRPLTPRFLDSNNPEVTPWLVRMIQLVNEAYNGPGNSRQIAVIVTNRSIDESEELSEISAGELERLLAGGANALPEAVRNAPRPAGCKATAMVYHFQRTQNGRLDQRFVRAADERRIARRHLDRARLTALA